MISDNHDRPIPAPLTNDEILDIALTALDGIPDITCDDVQRKFESIRDAQPSRCQQVREAQRRLMRACSALNEWSRETFAQPGLSAALGVQCMEIARDTAMRELHDVGLGAMAISIEAAYAAKSS